ncbi:type IV toxin-antitoxin system AbiEi family antitoxin domain-containing protein [Nocardia suismassiliense]|uniref:type IV toxin-antitoxin system AbiEi family antitoxin domain-containing protein n=1 Tax=Nocardia suismassiliense TaxID=2077092 RepID=UPI00131F2E7C|nr:type IV toxin-antitoxin system AbiEi family antitoxin domain-containing protein [Nocardia suismassiliense]
MRARLERLRDGQFGVFTAAQVLGEYTQAELRTRVLRGEWVRVCHGVYREASTSPVAQLRVEAARLSMGLPTLIAGYDTAAELHGFSVIDSAATHVIGRQRSRSKQIVVHQDRVDSLDLELVKGTLTTSPVRTAVDLARTLDRLDALATLDAALRVGLSPGRVSHPLEFSRQAMDEEATRHRGRRGLRQAVELIRLADGRAESPMESRTRVRCIDAGLPYPEPQVEVSTPTGLRRLDLGWRESRVGLEYDSATWHSGRHAAARDTARHNSLTTQGWTIFYATALDVLHHPHLFTEPIRAMLDRAAGRSPQPACRRLHRREPNGRELIMSGNHLTLFDTTSGVDR